MGRVFAITALTERVGLKDGEGQVTFTVTNTSGRPLQGRAKLVPLGSVKADWLEIEGERERDFGVDATHQYTVRVKVPEEAPEGLHTFRLNTVSVNNPDEDYEQGPTVGFEVAASKPVAARSFPWWILAVVGAVVLVAAVGTWLLLSGGADPVDPNGDGQDPGVATVAPDRIDSFLVRQTWHGDFDRGREVPRDAPRSESDFWFEARTATDRVLVPENDARLAMLGEHQSPGLADVRAALDAGTLSEIDVRRLTPGLWIAVRTSEGAVAAFTVEEEVGPSPGDLRVRYRYWNGEG